MTEFVGRERYQDAFAGKRVLITGGAGFLGSNLAHVLVPLGAQVAVFDAELSLYGANRFNLRGIEQKIRWLAGDIRNQKQVDEAVQGQDFIFHLAAQVSYLESMERPFLDLEINARGTLHILDAMRRLAPEAKLIFTSSRLVYGRILTNPVSESHPTQPLSIYGVHKLAAEKYCRIAFDTHGLRSSVLRIPNPYGPRQQMKHAKYSIVGWFIRQAMENKTLYVFGDGKQQRDYIYVDDITDAMLRVAASEKTDGEVYNVGTHERIRFVDMVETVIEVVGRGKKKHIPWPEGFERNETGDYIADTRKIEAAVGWRAQTPLREGIRRTWEYYQRWRKHYW
jgi:UDP-glucose 4-epimerase